MPRGTDPTIQIFDNDVVAFTRLIDLMLLISTTFPHLCDCRLGDAEAYHADGNCHTNECNSDTAQSHVHRLSDRSHRSALAPLPGANRVSARQKRKLEKRQLRAGGGNSVRSSIASWTSAKATHALIVSGDLSAVSTCILRRGLGDSVERTGLLGMARIPCGVPHDPTPTGARRSTYRCMHARTPTLFVGCKIDRYVRLSSLSGFTGMAASGHLRWINGACAESAPHPIAPGFARRSRR